MSPDTMCMHVHSLIPTFPDCHAYLPIIPEGSMNKTGTYTPGYLLTPYKCDGLLSKAKKTKQPWKCFLKHVM